MIFLKFHDEDGPTLVNLDRVASIAEDSGVLNISMQDTTMYRVPGRMAHLEAAFEQINQQSRQVGITILDL